MMGIFDLMNSKLIELVFVVLVSTL